MSKIIVIGGGAAGMMAAAAAAEYGNTVILIEKNEKLGKKVFITGKGRCNLTNACDIDILFEQVVTNSKFLYSAFYDFDNQAVIRFFEQAGCRMKTERGERVFPVSDHSSDVIAALGRILDEKKVQIRFRTTVASLILENGKIIGVLLDNGAKIGADAVILATGGLSYPVTGSTGDGYKMAELCGHTKKKLYPALVPLEIKEDWCRKMQGLSLKNVQASIVQDDKKVLYEGFGEMLFTHFGVSGPLILSAGSYYAGRNRNEKPQEDNETGTRRRSHTSEKKQESVRLRIDLKPALSEEQLDRRVLRDFEENKNKQFKNSLGGLFPSKMIPIIIELSGINEERKVNEITREERIRFVRLIKCLEMTVTGTRGFEEAIITGGGISVKEVNPSTMESKLIKGLFFAGEILDTDALTGGFNLQIAWSTGHLAGVSAGNTGQNTI